MIIACPACATRYVVPDSAIGLEGRTVRCAKCKHSWFQDGPEIDASRAATPAGEGAVTAEPPPPAPMRTRAEPSGHAAPLPEADPEPASNAAVNSATPAESTGDELATGTSAQPASPAMRPPAETPAPPVSGLMADPAFPDAPPPGSWNDEPVLDGPAEDAGVSHFDHGPPFRPRRNWLRWLTWGAGAFAAVALAGAVAVSTLGLPSWLPVEQPLFGSDPGLKVDFPASEQERRTLPNGAEFFGARVVITNPTRETKTVPPLLIVLRDSRERVVYSWELTPPQRTLAPGEAMTINEAMTDVPKSAVYADIGWAPR